MLVEAAITIAKAVIGHASARGAQTLGTRLLGVLRGTPVERAVARAVQKTDDQLAEKHPRARVELFDEHFLKQGGAPVLAGFLVPGETPRADDLVARWADQWGPHGERYARDHIVAAARDVLDWFEMAREQEPEALGELLDRRSARATATASTTTASLLSSQQRRAWIDPEERYRALDVERFAGRQWLLDQLGEFLRRYTSGYFVLTAAAGMGSRRSWRGLRASAATRCTSCDSPPDAMTPRRR